MDRNNQDNKDRSGFARLSTALKVKMRSRQKAPVPIPKIAEPAKGAPILPPSSTTLPADQAPEDSEGVNTGSSDIVSDGVAAISTSPPAPAPVARADHASDRENTENRYREAVKQLKKSVKLPRKNWETFDIPDFKNLADVNNPIPQLQEDIKKTLDAKKDAFEDPSFWSKSKRVTEKIFTAITPFAKNVLLVAKEGSNVFSVEKLLTDLVGFGAESIWLALWWIAPFNHGSSY